MTELIQIGPIDYRMKLKERNAVALETANNRLKAAQDLVITDTESLRGAKEDHAKWREDLKTLEEDRKAIVGPLNAVVDEVNASFKEPAEILKQARLITEKKATAYEAKVEADRRAAEEKARAEAKKEEERIRKEKEEQAAAWQKKQDEAKEREEAALKAGDSEGAEKARKDAEKAEIKAQERQEQAETVFVAPTIAHVEKVKVAGTKAITRYYARILDKNKVPVEWCGREIRPVSESVLGEIAKALKIDTTRKDPSGNVVKSPIEGVEFYSEARLS